VLTLLAKKQVQKQGQQEPLEHSFSGAALKLPMPYQAMAQ
jgi:hypothetical protein